MSGPLLIGAVAYTPNVVPIWEGIREYFRGSGADMDFVLFSNYGRQVDALIAGHIDIAWNTNLAWVRTVAQTGGGCHALAMRDTDLTFQTMLVSRAGAGLGGPLDLKGRRLALGSRDSAQAAILPVYYLRRAGLREDDVELTRIDSDLGKHGDTGRSELDAIRLVLHGDADAAAIGNTTWEAIGRDELMPGALEAFWTSPTYCHCNFTALDALPAERSQPWVDHLLAMDWENPEHRRILELEGLRRWVRPQLDGYASLFEAVEEQQIPARWGTEPANQPAAPPGH
jgi:phosphonate transport system substrate-binding protein